MTRQISYDCPAFTAYKLTPDLLVGYIKLTDGMKLAINVNGMFRRYTVGALRLDNLKPGQTYEDMVAKELAKNDGKRHWINQDATVITSGNTAKETRLSVELGDTVLLQGIVYTVERRGERLSLRQTESNLTGNKL